MWQWLNRALNSELPIVFRAECTETCKMRRRELDTENKQLQRDLKIKEEHIAAIERELVVSVFSSTKIY